MLLSVNLYIIVFLITIFLLIKILKIYFENRFKVLLSYVFAAFFMAVVALTMILDLIYEIEFVIGPLRIEPIDYTMTFAIVAAIVSWYFAVTLSHSSIPPKRSYLIVFIAGMVLMGELLERSATFLIDAALETIGITFAAAETFNYLRGTYKEVISSTDKKYLKLYAAGFTTILSSGLMPVLGDIAVKYQHAPRQIFEPGWAIPYSVGLLLLLYTVSKRPLVFTLSKAYPTLFVLLNQVGSPYFIQEFQSPENSLEPSEVDIFNLYNSAKELINSGKKIGTVDQGKRKILINVHEGITGMLVVNIETRYLREILQKATQLFWERYHETLPKWNGKISQFIDFKKDVMQIFSPFTPIDRTVQKMDLEAKMLDPLNKENRILALLTDYTSNKGECPYYSEDVPSKCLLDPTSRRPWDCEGKAFVKGFVCQYILDHLEKKASEQASNLQRKRESTH
ncbi:MAG: hypothetical protein ACTSYM_02005 [Candidatus Baldrarchaeia archaeon]